MSRSFYVDRYHDDEEGEGWRTMREGAFGYINTLSHAIELAQREASRSQVRTRVVREDGTTMAEFQANGQRASNRHRHVKYGGDGYPIRRRKRQ